MRKIWGSLYYYMGCWLIIYEKDTRHSKSLLLSSYHHLVWVVLIGITANTFSFSTTYPQSNMTSWALPPNMGMDIDDFVSSNVDNYDNIRDCTMTSNKNSSRTVSISSSKASVDYTTKIEQLNDISEETVFKELIDSSQLSYVDEEEIQVSRITDHENRACPQCDNSNVPALKSTLPQHVDNNVINIQLPYDPNALIESKL